MPEPHLRASDADRNAVAAVLGEHMSAGRLTVGEYEDRLARAYAARTYGELTELTTDLPAATPAAPVPLPAERSTRPVRWADWHGADAWAWRAWARTAVIVTTIWAVTCLASWELLYFWPVWVIGPWGAVLVAQTFFGDDEDDADPGDRGPEALPGR